MNALPLIKLPKPPNPEDQEVKMPGIFFSLPNTQLPPHHPACPKRVANTACVPFQSPFYDGLGQAESLRADPVSSLERAGGHMRREKTKPLARFFHTFIHPPTHSHNVSHYHLLSLL